MEHPIKFRYPILIHTRMLECWEMGMDAMPDVIYEMFGFLKNIYKQKWIPTLVYVFFDFFCLICIQ